ncbi:MAG: hypothetical protein IGS03_05125 [Candidatus Sericytochromatia bacterium]|nr:hypothetical protein [Candidatus Sericytochromatia bacterium]
MRTKYQHRLGLSLVAGLIMTTPLAASAGAQHTHGQAFVVAQAPVSISDAEVNQLVANMVAAAKSKNAKQLVSYFLPDATIELTLPPEMGGKQTLKPATYEKLLKEGWAALSKASYTYEVKNIQFKLYPEKKHGRSLWRNPRKLCVKRRKNPGRGPAVFSGGSAPGAAQSQNPAGQSEVNGSSHPAHVARTFVGVRVCPRT